MTLDRDVEAEEADSDYRESEDEDFNPEAPETNASDEEEDDSEAKKLDAAYSKFQGSGGLIKTRAQRRAEAERREASDARIEKSAPIVGSSSIDVDSLWEEMNSSASPKVETPSSATATPQPLGDEHIVVTRTFKFAGEVKIEEKTVLKNSVEGQDYLKQKKLEKEEDEQRRRRQQQQQRRQTESDDTNKSSASNTDQALDDNPKGAGLTSHGQAEGAAGRRVGREPVKRKMSLMEEYQMNKTKKINTLEKSRLDWLGFVDKEGINADLKKHNKGGYLDKQSFLNRVDEKVDRDIRQQRAKGP